jgi:hypothetical protein
MRSNERGGRGGGGVQPDRLGVQSLQSSASLLLEPQQGVGVVEPAAVFLGHSRHEFEVSLLPEIVRRALLLHVALQVQGSLASFQGKLLFIEFLL